MFSCILLSVISEKKKTIPEQVFHFIKVDGTISFSRCFILGNLQYTYYRDCNLGATWSYRNCLLKNENSAVVC